MQLLHIFISFKVLYVTNFQGLEIVEMLKFSGDGVIFTSITYFFFSTKGF